VRRGEGGAKSDSSSSATPASPASPASPLTAGNFGPGSNNEPGREIGGNSASGGPDGTPDAGGGPDGTPDAGGGPPSPAGAEAAEAAEGAAEDPAGEGSAERTSGANGGRARTRTPHDSQYGPDTAAPQLGHVTATLPPPRPGAWCLPTVYLRPEAGLSLVPHTSQKSLLVE